MSLARSLSKYLIIGATLAIALFPLLTFAQLSNPAAPLSGDELRLSDLEALIIQIAQFLIIVSMIIAVIFIIWGGIRWISAGGNDEAVSKAKATVINGIIGAAIVLAVGLILQTLAGVIARGLVL